MVIWYIINRNLYKRRYLFLCKFKINHHLEPYPSYNGLSAASRVSTGELKPSIPINIPQVIKQILLQCLQYYPNERPDFVAISDILEKNDNIFEEYN